MSGKSGYTREQIQKFFDYISLPQQYHDAENNLELLTVLFTYTLARIPYENLTIHYSPNHQISLDPQVLYEKIVGNARGRGGYCMENSIFFYHILRGLGYYVYTAPARHRLRVDGVPQGDYKNWAHIVNIVMFEDGSKYSVDVGFGGDGPTLLMPLIAGREHHNTGSQDIRLLRDWLPDQTKRNDIRQMYWIYQYRNGKEKEWNSFYAFLDMEFLPSDWDCVHWYTGSNPLSFHTFQVLVVKFLRRPRENGNDGVDEVYGKRMLVDGTVKENLGGRTGVVQQCTTEAERVEALKRWFDIDLAEEERQAIVGYKTELK